jgi:hypothetical protein
MDNKKTIECIHTFLEKEFQMNYDAGLYEGRQEALCALVNMVPGAILRTNDKVDIDTSSFDKEAFAEDAEKARIFELRLAYQLMFQKYEVKTIPYESWGKYQNILIEVGKETYYDKRGSLFQIECDGWLHQLLDENGEVFHQTILNVEYLKKRYEKLKHNKDNFKFCPNESSQATWCMPINLFVNDHKLLDGELLNGQLVAKNNELNLQLEYKEKEIQRNLDTIAKLEKQLKQL